MSIENKDGVGTIHDPLGFPYGMYTTERYRDALFFIASTWERAIEEYRSERYARLNGDSQPGTPVAVLLFYPREYIQEKESTGETEETKKTSNTEPPNLPVTPQGRARALLPDNLQNDHSRRLLSIFEKVADYLERFKEHNNAYEKLYVSLRNELPQYLLEKIDEGGNKLAGAFEIIEYNKKISIDIYASRTIYEFVLHNILLEYNNVLIAEDGSKQLNAPSPLAEYVARNFFGQQTTKQEKSQVLNSAAARIARYFYMRLTYDYFMQSKEDLGVVTIFGSEKSVYEEIRHRIGYVASYTI